MTIIDAMRVPALSVLLLASFAVGCESDERARSLLSRPPAEDAQSFAVGDWDPAGCFAAQTSDSDKDGVHDECERAIAKEFAPILVFDSTEVEKGTVLRETYWEVRRPFQSEELTIPLHEVPPLKNEIWILVSSRAWARAGPSTRVTPNSSLCRWSPMRAVTARIDGRSGESAFRLTGERNRARAASAVSQNVLERKLYSS